MLLADELDGGEETAALAVSSRLLQLDFAWRLGMDPGTRKRLVAEAGRWPSGPATCGRWRCCGCSIGARPGWSWSAKSGSRPPTRRRGSPTNRATCTCAWRSARASAYALCTPATSTASSSWLDEVIELGGDDPAVGAGIVIGSPVAWAHMGKATVRRERGEFEEAERLLEKAMRLSDGTQGPGDRRAGSAATQAHAARGPGRPRAAVALSRAQLRADRAARRRLLTQPRPRQPRLTAWSAERRPRGGAERDRGSREALPRRDGDGRRDGEPGAGAYGRKRCSASAGSRRRSAVARRTNEEGRRLGRRWSLPLALLAQARAEAANGEAEAARDVARRGRSMRDGDRVEPVPGRDRGRARGAQHGSPLTSASRR